MSGLWSFRQWTLVQLELSTSLKPIKILPVLQSLVETLSSFPYLVTKYVLMIWGAEAMVVGKRCIAPCLLEFRFGAEN